MTAPDPQPHAQEFFARVQAARLTEAEQVWATLVANGFRDGMVAMIDFLVFGRSEDDIRSLADQLKATYATRVSELPDKGWMMVGTTKPYGSRLDEAKHREWVSFMCGLAGASGLIFSMWSVEASEPGISVTSEAFGSAASDA